MTFFSTCSFINTKPYASSDQTLIKDVTNSNCISKRAVHRVHQRLVAEHEEVKQHWTPEESQAVSKCRLYKKSESRNCVVKWKCSHFDFVFVAHAVEQQVEVKPWKYWVKLQHSPKWRRIEKKKTNFRLNIQSLSNTCSPLKSKHLSRWCLLQRMSSL